MQLPFPLSLALRQFICAVVKAESCCEPLTINRSRFLTEQGGVAQFKESPLAQRNIIKAEPTWPDIFLKAPEKPSELGCHSLPSVQRLVCYSVDHGRVWILTERYFISLVLSVTRRRA